MDVPYLTTCCSTTPHFNKNAPKCHKLNIQLKTKFPTPPCCEGLWHPFPVSIPLASGVSVVYPTSTLFSPYFSPRWLRPCSHSTIAGAATKRRRLPTNETPRHTQVKCNVTHNHSQLDQIQLAGLLVYNSVFSRV